MSCAKKKPLYLNGPKFSGRQVSANSADPDSIVHVIVSVLIHVFMCACFSRDPVCFWIDYTIYRLNYHSFSDRQAWADSADPDKTGAV